MHKSKVFPLGEAGTELIALEETEWGTESVLQRFLVDYPDLLPGDQIDAEDPPRWLLVACGMGVPGDAMETGRWSLEHLFLDQNGVPIFIECKRASDTRVRREVVAQMLDYAANGTQYWSMDRIRQAAAETAKTRGRSLDREIPELLDDEEADAEECWSKVETNLREHRVCLVFGANSVPGELRRLVEFLNEEMTRVELLAVEIKQFKGETEEGQTALVPRVVGLTESARSLRRSSRFTHTTREEFLEKCSPTARAFFERVLTLAAEKGHTFHWGTTGFSIRLRIPEGLQSFAYGYPPRTFQFYFDQWLRNEEPGSGRNYSISGHSRSRETSRSGLTSLRRT